MAIKIQGTPVIDDSRNLINIGAIKGINYPAADGSNGQVLTTDGSGSLSFQDLPPAGPTVEAVASGTLPDGSSVVVNSDGTVEVVNETSFSFSTGNLQTFDNNVGGDPSMTFDSSSNKIVIAYPDGDNVNAGAARVGDLSGSSISFGAPVQFNNDNSSFIVSTFDSNSNKVVIAYKDSGNSYFGTAVVGTVSGSSISFGGSVVFKSANVEPYDAIFDTNSNKVVIAFRDTSNSNRGTSVVGTVSNNNISFGTPQVFESASSTGFSMAYDSNFNQIIFCYINADNADAGEGVIGSIDGDSLTFSNKFTFNSGSTTAMDSVFDNNSNRVVIAYGDQPNSEFGTAVVGETGSLSVSFGSPVVFESSATQQISTVFDDSVNTVIIFYKDQFDSNEGKVTAGTVTDSSINFDSPLVFSTVNAEGYTSTFDSSSNKVVTAVKDNSSPPTAGSYAVIQAPGSSTNLTEENFIGFSNAAYSDAETATIQTGGSVTKSQSGLTPGRTHFVQTDGAINTTPDSPSVRAGTALSSTDLLIKG